MEKRKPILLVRHAQAEHHIQSITGGWSNTALTPEGHRQSTRLSLRLQNTLNGRNIHLGTSSLRRARQTASIIASDLLLEPHIHPELSDLNNGLAAGKTHREARLLAIPQSEPLIDWQPYPQAETWRQFFGRVADFMQEFSASQQSAAVLVTHAANIQVIVAWWLGLSVESSAQFVVSPASLTLLRCNRLGMPALERLNDTAHLYTDGVYESLQI
jgi:probable phosphoglycerate mutase